MSPLDPVPDLMPSTLVKCNYVVGDYQGHMDPDRWRPCRVRIMFCGDNELDLVNEGTG